MTLRTLFKRPTEKKLQKYVQEFTQQHTLRPYRPNIALMFQHASHFVEKNPHLFSSKKDVYLFLALLLNETNSVLKKIRNKHCKDPNNAYSQTPYIVIETFTKLSDQWKEQREKQIDIKPISSKAPGIARKISRTLGKIPDTLRAIFRPTR
ncbi:MAG: hypothetical protein ACOY3I_02245 [Verrucomicrobiota bacterium]